MGYSFELGQLKEVHSICPTSPKVNEFMSVMIESTVTLYSFWRLHLATIAQDTPECFVLSVFIIPVWMLLNSDTKDSHE